MNFLKFFFGSIREYFAQIRPYFKHRSIAQQLLEHLWNNMIESSKVAFVKKILKEQKFTEISSTNFNDGMKIDDWSTIDLLFLFRE